MKKLPNPIGKDYMEVEFLVETKDIRNIINASRLCEKKPLFGFKIPLGAKMNNIDFPPPTMIMNALIKCEKGNSGNAHKHSIIYFMYFINRIGMKGIRVSPLGIYNI